MAGIHALAKLFLFEIKIVRSIMALLIVLFPFRLGSAIFQNEIVPQEVKKFPKGYFVEPTDSSINVAGNFGEIRPNHFHTGLDIKTGGREGMYVYAVAEGYVSRIKISANGYGKALYITHPNGYVTVYAHLQRLYGKIAKYLYDEQYKFETYEIDVTIPKDVLRVNQCDTVAIAGNTGSSQSPHLHFEIRDAVTENAYNPLLFGYKLKDHVAPKLKMLAVYPVNDSSYVNGKNLSRKMRLYGMNNKYKLSSAEKISVSGDIGFGIETYDYADVIAAGKLGAYSVDLYVDEKRIYYHELNEIPFDQLRYINSHIDYAEDMKSNREIQKCFRDPNNMLSIYQCVINDGVFSFRDSLYHSVKFIIKDFFGNASSADFKIKSVQVANKNKYTKSITDSSRVFKCSEENSFETKDVKVIIPPCSLYGNIDFEYSVSSVVLPKTFSPVHSIHKPQVPNHYSYSLSIKTLPIPEHLQSKATIVLLDATNHMRDMNGQYDNGWITTQTKFFGRYAVVVDTIKPMVRPRNIYNGKNMSHAKTIAVMIGDNLTGIKSYRATIDGKWVLMEYEPKKSLLFYEFPSLSGTAPQKTSKHEFELTVVDGKGNSQKYKTTFLR